MSGVREGLDQKLLGKKEKRSCAVGEGGLEYWAYEVPFDDFPPLAKIIRKRIRRIGIESIGFGGLHLGLLGDGSGLI